MFKDFKEFALRGNAMDMAVGIIIGAAFTKVVNSLVGDILMPPLGLITKSADFVEKWGVNLGGFAGIPLITLKIGAFLSATLQFLIVAFAVFLLVRAINRLRGAAPVPAPVPETRDCPYCCTKIPLKATRCPACTSTL